MSAIVQIKRRKQTEGKGWGDKSFTADLTEGGSASDGSERGRDLI